MSKAEADALRDLLELAQGYGTATPSQIGTIAARHGMPAWQLEGLYFDATETAGGE